MQNRRRKEIGDFPDSAWTKNAVKLWDKLVSTSVEQVCKNSGSVFIDEFNLHISCLNEVWHVNFKDNRIYKISGKFGGEWDRQIPFLILYYLDNAVESPISHDLVAPRELIEGSDFFQGLYKLETKELEDAFGNNGEEFIKIAGDLGGVIKDDADHSALFYIFPKLTIEYLLWVSDEELPARFNILIANNSNEHFPPDTIAMVINLLSNRLIFEKHTCVE